jgi:hypothetical protein
LWQLQWPTLALHLKLTHIMAGVVVAMEVVVGVVVAMVVVVGAVEAGVVERVVDGGDKLPLPWMTQFQQILN